tara:strand:+ start:1029 stop:1379 length:351 start_codon:yes stop_codon:yes gene_type:complete
MENRLEEMTVRAECAEMVCRETQRELLTTILEMCRHEDGSRDKLRKLKHIAEGLTTGRVDPHSKNLLSKIVVHLKTYEKADLMEQKILERNNYLEEIRVRDSALELPALRSQANGN